MANRLGFNYKDETFTVRSKGLLELIQRMNDRQLDLEEKVPMDGAKAAVLDGDQLRKSVSRTAAEFTLVGPFALVGTGREIAVEITGADGTKLVSTTPKSNRSMAQKFCAAVNNSS